MIEDATLEDITVEDIEAMGLECQLVDGEFKINFAGGRELTAYYAPDPASAIEVARIMHELQKGLG